MRGIAMRYLRRVDPCSTRRLPLLRPWIRLSLYDGRFPIVAARGASRHRQAAVPAPSARRVRSHQQAHPLWRRNPQRADCARDAGEGLSLGRPAALESVSLVLDEHRAYLADVTRLGAFERAIAATVRPGDIVIDLGSGTGILGLLAARAGAARVYAIEETSLSGLAREIAAANGLSDRVEVVRGWSTWVTLPEKADVLVTDQIGQFGIEAGLFEYLPDARRRLLKAGARTIPRAITWRLAPVESAALREALAFWREPRAGFNFSAVARPAGASGYPAQLNPQALLAPAGALASSPADALPASGLIEGDVTFVVHRAGMLDGLGGWFVAELAPGVSLTNAPDSSERIKRQQVVLPTGPVAVSPGDRVRARVRFRPTTLMVDWQVTVTDAHGVERAKDRRSTFEGMLIAPEDLAVKSPTARPLLSRRGAARRSVLNLCDGSRTVGEIEAELKQEYPDILNTDEEAAAFLAEVLTSDAT